MQIFSFRSFHWTDLILFLILIHFLTFSILYLIINSWHPWDWTQFQYCPREAKRSRGFLWCSRGLVVHKTTRTTRWHLGFDRKLDQETTRTPQEFWSSCGLLVESPTQPAQSFFWFLWSRGPRDHKNTTRILVFSWSLGWISYPGKGILLVLVVHETTRTPREFWSSRGL